MDSLELIEQYKALKLHEVIDHEKFSQYAIVHHSTTIEGSTLTAIETQLLLDEGVTPSGRPLLHSLMAKDHFDALQEVIKQAGNHRAVSVETIQDINARVMKHTGNIYETVFGKIDASKGEFKKGNVQAGNTYFVNYDKVVSYTKELVKKINEKIEQKLPLKEQLELSFSAHFDLVTIHPFYDGNGRTSRLLMNYLQRYFGLPLAIVFSEDKAAYFEALQQTRKEEDIQIFFDFMYGQYNKHLQQEITAYKSVVEGKRLKLNSGKGKGFSLFF